MSDAMSRLCEIAKWRDLFAFDHAKKIKEATTDGQNLFLSDIKLQEII
jgi:hypothetical protein